jgi:hypothetical protein
MYSLLKNLTFPKLEFFQLFFSVIFEGLKKLVKIAKFHKTKTREKLVKLETNETTNDLQGLSCAPIDCTKASYATYRFYPGKVIIKLDESTVTCIRQKV